MINGAGGRRQWSVDDKARIIAETLEPNAIISEVARRYGLRPQQVFAWRREARKQAASVQQDSPAFVPAVVGAPEPIARRPPKQRNRKDTRDAGVIELEIDGIAMRVGRGADTKTVAAVIRALKATT
ncbi:MULTISPECIES: transposase [unclassified Mesorhizobium]|uniref:IS66-like element accessory protein TnpA n=1 Tax=unclassified Mesorhizobium TaxID=325217 RepID=UPI001FED4B36|nr:MULTISPECIES: transposase [unclassified Mesorhizobium]